jgi:hypothetical protein
MALPYYGLAGVNPTPLSTTLNMSKGHLQILRPTDSSIVTAVLLTMSLMMSRSMCGVHATRIRVGIEWISSLIYRHTRLLSA